MPQFLRQKLVLRLTALLMLILCLIVVSRSESKARLVTTMTQSPVLTQTQPPVVTATNQPGAPLVITAGRPASADPQNTDILFTVTNVSKKAITAFVIKHDIEAGARRQTWTLMIHLQLTKQRIAPNVSINEITNFEILSEQQHHLQLSVEYVEFSDGTKWAFDSAKLATSSEVISGERAAVLILSKKLMKLLQNGGDGDVINAIDGDVAKIEPPAGHSEDWKAGFRLGCRSLVGRLKRAQSKGGWVQVDAELHQIADSFKGS
jgi:hypothetical protein